MSINRVISHCIGIGISLFLLDFPIAGPISTSRIGFLLILMSFLLKVGHNNTMVPKMPQYLKPVIISLTFVFTAVIISSVYHMTEVSRVISWIFLFISLILFPRFLNNKEEAELIIKRIAVYSFFLLVILIVYCVQKYGIFAFMNKSLRYGVNELPPGLNRIMNGVVFANIYVLVYYSIYKTKMAKYLVILCFIMSFWFVLSSYTRQGFILESILLIGFGRSIYTTFRYKTLGLIIVTLVLGFIFYKITQSEVFIENFINRTQDQVENDEGSTAYRAYLYRRGFEFIENNFFVGIGPDNFLNYVGKDAHSGYLNVVAETGVLSLLSILILIISSTVNIVKNYVGGVRNMFFWMVITIFLAPMFKTIYSLPMFWTGVVIVFFYNNYSINYSVNPKVERDKKLQE